ncbi:MAG: (Fe-S)-binding protein [Promethearchaeota archaeon]
MPSDTNSITSNDINSDLIKEIFESDDTRTLFTCFHCGKCTSACPVAEQFPYNPHQIVKLGSRGIKGRVIEDQVLRYCLTCGNCMETCPQGVNFIEFIKKARRYLIDEGKSYEETHDGILTTITELQAKNSSGFKLTNEMILKEHEIAHEGKVAYFFGCLPILDVIFDYLDVNLMEIVRNAVGILSTVLGTPPVLIEDIKCCGHDALWKGHYETFKKLAEHNVKLINELGIDTIVTTCAECYRTLKMDYPKHIKNINFKVIHLSELIEEKLRKNELQFSETFHEKVTYHDPCRLGRHMKIYDPPREILTAMQKNGIIFKEMERIKENAPCCGVSCFINCNDISKALQMDRLMEAKEVANLLVTTCPKCQIHYKCFLHEKKEKDDEIMNLKITDLTNLIAKLMGLGSSEETKV